MGDPKKQRKKYSRPLIPWNKERIEIEKALIKEYGLKNKKEIYKANSLLKKYFSQSKKLITNKTEQGNLERQKLLNKLSNLGLLKPEAQLSDVLGITIENLLDRRLQTIIFKKKLTKSINQSRQFIAHQHVTVAGKKITSPSYLVSKKEEDMITFSQSSKLSNPEHIERIISVKKAKKDDDKKPKDKKDKRPKRRKVTVRKKKR